MTENSDSSSKPDAKAETSSSVSKATETASEGSAASQDAAFAAGSGSQQNDARPASGFSLGTVIEDAKRVITDPVGFFQSMPKTGGFAEPVIFVAVMAAICGAVMAFFSLFGADNIGMFSISFWSIIWFPIVAVFWSFVAALVMFVVWKLMGADTDFEAAYRSIAYCTAIYPIVGVLSLIPYVGTIVGIAWGAYLLYVTSKETHGISENTALIAIAALALIVLVTKLSTEYGLRQLDKKAEQLGEAAESFKTSVERGIRGGSDVDGTDIELDVRMERLNESVESIGGQIGERLGRSLEELENVEDMTPEEAGRAFGKFIRDITEAAEEFEKGYNETISEPQPDQ